jgi:GT2 family glycosyltransferase
MATHHTNTIQSSIIIANYNGKRFLKPCLEAIQALDYPRAKLQVILVDNGSTDGSIEHMQRHFPWADLLQNDRNNYARALNKGIQHARGDYIGFLNNDTVVEPNWLRELVTAMEGDDRIGLAGGKMLLPDGRINSTGIIMLPEFYFIDRGFGEADRGQFESMEDVSGICGGAALYRKSCLEDVGPIDEDFVLYSEDVDMSLRCKKKGWKIRYIPTSIVHHRYKGTSGGSRVCYYFSNRNRLLILAKHFPRELPTAIKTSHFYINKELDALYKVMPWAFKKLIESHEDKTACKVLQKTAETLVKIFGPVKVDNLMAKMEVLLGLRRPSIAIYDHALHFLGGGQRYGAVMGSVLRDRYDVTFIANKSVALEDIEKSYGIDLSGCRLVVKKIPFYERRKLPLIDHSLVVHEKKNPFDVISHESMGYDIFVNANMLPKVRPLSPVSIFICHFPDSYRDNWFAADAYTHVIVNSSYGAKWLWKFWRMKHSGIVNPPADMQGPETGKENLILSVARMEPLGSKKQKEMLLLFRDMIRDHPQLKGKWRLILAGGSTDHNPYLDRIRELAAATEGTIDIRVNLTLEDLRLLYAKARIFWHACGLGEDDPKLIEHFGMTTVEAMQNRCVPVVINGGGQKEIVEHGVSGFRFNTARELTEYTLSLIGKPELMERMGNAAFDRSKAFSAAKFKETIRGFFGSLVREYASLELPEIKADMSVDCLT